MLGETAAELLLQKYLLNYSLDPQAFALKNETKQNLVYEVVCSLQKFENHFICWSRSTVMKDFLTISDWSAEVKMLIVFK